MKARSSPEIPPTVPTDLIGGHFRSFRKDPTGFLTRLSKLGDVAAFRLGRQPAFFLNDPDLIREVFVLQAEKFIKGRALQRAKNLLGEGLLTSEGAFHLRQRRMIQPAFHRSRIAEYARSMVEFAEKTSGKWVDGTTLDVDRAMMYLTLQIVGKTLFGARVEDDADSVGKAMTSVTELFNFLLFPFSEWLQKLPLPQSRRFHHARNTLNSVIYGIIDERRRSGQNNEDLLSMLLLAQDEDDGSVMTDEQVRDEAMTLFLAGHETTANLLTFTWYLLSQNPEAETKLHAELDHVLAGREPTMDDLPHLKFTERVIAESMRLFPPAWAVGRLAAEELSLGGYTVPKGGLVLISPYVTHRDGRFWDCPDDFIPERWEAITVKEVSQKNIYFPFGGGVRRCIGESFAWTEGILVLAAIARNWQLTLDPSQKIALQPMITLRPKYGMKMRLSRR
ncbi:MAG: cytochrome P450 [Pyrinomonadaceae bacterium]